MPLILESLDVADGDEPLVINHHVPAELPGSLSNFSPLLGRQIILFECSLDDTTSTICVSRSGTDTDIDQMRMVDVDLGALDVVRELHDGESHDMTIFTDGSIVPIHIRFRHQKVDFGQRSCPVCETEVPTNIFGHHITEHINRNELPAGIRVEDILECYRKSIINSIQAAHGFSKLQQPLRKSLEIISQLIEVQRNRR